MDAPAVPSKSPMLRSGLLPPAQVETEKPGGKAIFDPALALTGEGRGKRLSKSATKGHAAHVQGRERQEPRSPSRPLRTSPRSSDLAQQLSAAGPDERAISRELGGGEKDSVRETGLGAAHHTPGPSRPDSAASQQRGLPHSPRQYDLSAAGRTAHPDCPSPSDPRFTGDTETATRLSHRLFLALKTKPTLTRTWEKKAFTDEIRATPLAESVQAGNVDRERFETRPSSLYASPAALRSFRALPLTAPPSPLTMSARNMI